MPQPPPALRDLTPSTPDASRQWKVVGLERAHVCTFCGGPSEATVGCPDENAPLIWQIGICNHCLVDCCMQRFRQVKHQRAVQLADDMRSAANAVRKARDRAGQARYERRRRSDPEIEAEAIRQLAAEEEAIARKHDMCPGWTYDEFVADMAQLRAARDRFS
jgi:hypothetical protein